MALIAEKRRTLVEAFRQGKVSVKSVDSETGQIEYRRVTKVHRHASGDKLLKRIYLENGMADTFTLDHSVFVRDGDGVREVTTASLATGVPVVVVESGVLTESPIQSFEYVDPEEFTYDLEVPANQNFVLTSGILAHNSYSIGGISLDIEKSSKYESLKNNAESRWDQAIEQKEKNTIFFKGLAQPRFGIGIRSAFGPYTARGVLSPRAYIG